MRRLAFSVAIVAATSLSFADELRGGRVQLPRGTATVRGSIVRDASVDYLVGAVQGQVMSVRMKSDDAGCSFDVLPPGYEPALHIGSQQGPTYRGTVLETGDYVVTVHRTRSALPRDQAVRYTITFAIETPAAAPPPS